MPRNAPVYIQLGLILLSLALGSAVIYVTGNVLGLVLYAMPLIFIGILYGRLPAVIAATAVAGLRTAMLRMAGQPMHAPLDWVLDILGYGLVFGLLGLLGALLREGRLREIRLRRTDVLTGLANRPSFYERAYSALALCKRNMRAVSLACLDLDNFMQINEQLGHTKADAMLRAVASSLTGSVRASDIVARFGSDVFALLLPEAGPKDIRLVLDKIRQQVVNLPELKAHGVTVTIGAITYSHAPAELEPMIAAAEGALASAKKAGKDRTQIQTAAAVVG